MSSKLIAQLKSKILIDQGECWNWVGLLNHEGYGRNGFGLAQGFSRRAHRASWQVFNGDIPKGLMVCHSCDNPSCINPKHLFLSDNAGNLKDMRDKGRSPLGEKHWKHKLSDPEIKQIRESKLSGLELSQYFKISKSQVSNIRSNRRRFSQPLNFS